MIDLTRRATETVVHTLDNENLGVNASPNGGFVFATDFTR
jgi:hypothetical protein